MNFFNDIKNNLITIINEIQKEGKIPSDLDLGNIAAEPPRDIKHGDVATNAAMVLAKSAGMKPRDLAELIIEKLKSNPNFTEIEIAGAGFINIRLSDSFWYNRLKYILKQGTKFGKVDIGNGQKINVEYVSVNPTGPMHGGHARGAVYGDVLASLMEKAGYYVTREYYVNDAGGQVDVLARSLFLRYKEALGYDIGEIPEGLYPGDYLVPAGQKIAERDGKKWENLPETDWLSEFRKFAVSEMLDLIKDDLKALGIKHDVFFSEKEMVDSGGVKKVIEYLQSKDLIYRGVLEPPKGKLPDDWEPREQLLFRAKDFGDDVDRPLQKADGSFTYFASDIAYHLDKFNRGFNYMINVWGADHGGYVKRMQSAIKAVTGGKAKLDVKLVSMVNLMENGEPIKMSKRAGTFVTLRDIIDAVGKDVIRFIMLTRKNDVGLDFDLEKVKEQSKDNPVFYVQYAHARCQSVIRHAKEMFGNINLEDADLSILKDESELSLIKLMATWPKIVESAAEAAEPHRIAYYLGDLAGAFHSLWNKGRDETHLRFLYPDDVETSKARLVLVNAIATVIASGLEIFGVTPVEEM
ncbi:MAG: arginine--tRNA ligase [Alphaproteobacteria bacterium]